MKYFLLLALIAVIWWWVKRPRGNPASQPAKPAQEMVQCAECGIYLPKVEGVSLGDRHYCCEAHRKAGSRQ